MQEHLQAFLPGFLPALAAAPRAELPPKQLELAVPHMSLPLRAVLAVSSPGARLSAAPSATSFVCFSP